MNDSMAQLSPGLVRTDAPGWKSVLSWVSSLVLCGLFMLSGLWKITDVQGTAVRMVQAKVPESLGLAAALFFGIVETVGAVMILVPRLRRWGAVVLGALLLAFLGYFAVQYDTLRGADCSCIPWLKRVVGPGFFVGDGVMLLMAVLAGLGSRRPEGKRAVVLIAAAVTVFAGVSYGVGAARETGTRAPESIVVDGRPYSLEHGKIFLFYFDPACMHCFESAQRMSKLNWGETRVFGGPIAQLQVATQFMQDTVFHMAITADRDKLKAVFHRTLDRESIRKATGITQEAVLDNLVQLSLSGEMMSAFQLFPLVEVAWADSVVDEREIRAVLEAAHDHGIVRGSASHSMLENALKSRPNEDARKAWYMYAGELRKTLSPHELTTFRNDLLEHARRVAKASGGILNAVFQVSHNESKVLKAIAKALTNEPS